MAALSAISWASPPFPRGHSHLSYLAFTIHGSRQDPLSLCLSKQQTHLMLWGPSCWLSFPGKVPQNIVNCQMFLLFLVILWNL